MNAETRELVELSRKLGFTGSRITHGGHVVVTGPSGTVTLPSTGSDWRGRKNAIAEMERVSGRKLDRAKTRRSHKAAKPSGFRLDTAAAECRARRDELDAEVVALLAQRAKLIEECRELTRDRGLLRQIPTRVTAIGRIELKLLRLGSPVEAFDPLSLAR